MKDQFKNWNNLKTQINKKQNSSLFNEREICFVNLWKNIWFEQDWKHEKFERPVIVLKKFSSLTFIWIPLTGKEKKWKFYFPLNLKWRITSAILSQIRLFDAKRIERKIWYISKENFEQLKLKLQKLIF